MLHGHAVVHHAVVHDGDVGDVARVVNDRDIVPHDMAVDPALVDIPFIHVDVPCRRTVAIHLHISDLILIRTFRWDRCPAAVTTTVAPRHPGRSPDGSGNPNPAPVGSERPLAIV